MTFPEIPSRPSRDEALAALEALKEPMREYVFATDAARSVCLSAILTGQVRRILRTAPLHVFDAPQAGSGKTKAAFLSAIIATGREPTTVALALTEEEVKKTVFALLLSGDPVVCFDNVVHAIDSATLCAVLTSEVWSDRILGVSKTGAATTNVLLTATGNNVAIRGDMTNRTIVCRIEPGVEVPSDVKHGFDPVDYAREHRPRLVAAGLTVLRAYAAAGWPGWTDLRPSRFRDWDKIVRGALVWLDAADPLDTQTGLLANDSEHEDLTTLMDAWEEVFGLNIEVRAIEVLERFKADFDEKADALNEALLTMARRGDGGLSAKGIGKRLKGVVGRVIGTERPRKFTARKNRQDVTVFWLGEIAPRDEF